MSPDCPDPHILHHAGAGPKPDFMASATNRRYLTSGELRILNDRNEKSIIIRILRPDAQ